MLDNSQEITDIRKRLLYFIYIGVFFFILIFLRLWYLQVIKGDYYKGLSENNRLRIVKITPPRGIIYDRNGIPLVENRPSFDVSLILEDLPEGGDTIERLAELLGLPAEDIKRKIAEYKQKEPFQPVKIKENVSWEEVAKVEARRLELPGVQVDVEVTRNYIYGGTGFHLIGYLGRITEEQAREEAYANFPQGGLVGQWGIEKSMDYALRGIPGERLIEVDALGHVVRVIGEKDPTAGDDIYLTIDLKTQKAAEESLGKEAGAIVAISPENGDLLALVSHPSPDPNIFTKGIPLKEWNRLLNDPFYPLINRVIQHQSPPGSTFKMVMAAAGLETGKIEPSTEVFCRGSIRFGNRDFRCWKEEGHQRVSLHKAIVESCDVYFYELGKRLGIDLISYYAEAFGLGRITGIPLSSEKAGLVPSTEWKMKVKGQPWFPGETLSVSIGQGALLATPIQMASLAAAISNGGILYSPRFIKEIRGMSNHLALRDPSKNRKKIRVSDGTLRFLRDAMGGVVEEDGGTGWRARSQLTKIAGKTGTSQVIRMKDRLKPEDLPRRFRDHAWFIAFAPVDDARIAVSVFVEHGGAGGVAGAPIAKRVIEGYMNNK
jgi:penicillin-binding protein 2